MKIAKARANLFVGTAKAKENILAEPAMVLFQKNAQNAIPLGNQRMIVPTVVVRVLLI
ncbi:MAG: hypothetical protein NTX03_09240 [Bacteroidetes bacterium]|nr:hypothetical protein [Bacteroidota bacterium]